MDSTNPTVDQSDLTVQPETTKQAATPDQPQPQVNPEGHTLDEQGNRYYMIEEGKMAADQDRLMIYFHRSEKFRFSMLQNELKVVYDALLAKASAGKVLEVGCAGGHLIQYLRTLWPDAKYVGMDISDKAVEMAQTFLAEPIKNGKVSIEKADWVSSLCEDKGPYDLIVLFKVLVWVRNPPELLKRVYSTTVPGGWVWIENPAADIARGVNDPAFQRIVGAGSAAMAKLGLDMDVARIHTSLLTEAGFINIKTVKAVFDVQRFGDMVTASLDAVVSAATQMAGQLNMGTDQLLAEVDGIRGRIGKLTGTQVFDYVVGQRPLKS